MQFKTRAPVDGVDEVSEKERKALIGVVSGTVW